MDDKLIRLARKVKTLEDELSHLSQIKDLEGLLVASTDMNSRYKKSINETVGMYKEYISNTKKELTDSFEAIKKDYDSKKDSYKKNMNNLETKINKVKDDIQKVCTSIDKSIEDIQKDILKDIKDKNTQILNEIGKKDKELKEVKNESASLVKDLKALKDLVNKLELQKGDDGKSAYDIACELGFKGTKEEWIKSLHGKDGQDIELRGLRAFSDVKNDNKMYARKNKKWVEVEEPDLTDYVKNTDYANSSKGGVIKTASSYNTAISNGALYAQANDYETYQNKGNGAIIGKGTLENVITGKQLVNETELDVLREENARLKATLPTTTGSGENITLDKTAELDFIQPPLPRGNSEQATSILPTGYTQLDYIESTGTQYIDTGYTPVQGDDFEIKNVTVKSNGMIFYAGTGDYQLGILIYNTAQGYFKYFATGDAPQFSEPYITNGNIKITNGILYYNNSWKTSSAYAGTVNTTLQIFRRPTGANYISAQIGEIIISNNGTIKRDYIPCKNANNEVGLYDLVSKTFFGNSGTGTFTAGNTVTVPNPSYPQAISNVTGDVEVLVQNKNLFDVSKITENRYINSETGVDYTSSASNITDYIFVKANITYAFSFNYTSLIASSDRGWALYDTNKSFINGNRVYSPSSKKVIFTPTQDGYVRFTYDKNCMDIMLEQNTTATTYTPNQEQTLPLTLGNIELCKIGTAQDYFYKENDKWYLYKAIGKAIFDGSSDENWSYYSNTGVTNRRFIIAISDMKQGTNNQYPVLCNRFKQGSNSTDDNFVFVTSSNKIVWFGSTDLQSLDTTGFKTWLSSNNVIVYYLLDTPTTTEITDTTLINELEAISQAISYEEQTNISGSSDGANPIFSVEAYQSIKLILAS